MLLDRYEPFFFNANFKENTADGAWAAYRGELVLKEGEVADAQGRRKPPIEVLRQAIVLTGSDELKLLAGSIDELQYYPALVEKYAGDIQAGSLLVLYTVNIDKPFQTRLNGASIVFIPMVQGMVWNELIDLVALEKSDFKGQGAAEKVVTLFKALKDHTFKYPEIAVDDALKTTNNAKRETHGAI